MAIVAWLLASNAAGSLVDACNTRAQHALQQTPIVFFSASAELTSNSAATIQRLAEIALDCPDAQILVGGHTDNRGDPAANQILSRERAQAVANAIASLGIAASRISAIGYGSTQPVADNTTRADRRRNRRITVLFSATDRRPAN